MARSGSFTITPSDLFCPEAYITDDNSSLRQDDFLEYDCKIHRAISERTVFWGPYIPLDAGVYLFTFHGRLVGDLVINFSCAAGASVLKEVNVNNFDQPICLIITKPVDEFEVRGRKTDTLEHMRVERISIVHIMVKDGG
jgi:hypothetical protein